MKCPYTLDDRVDLELVHFFQSTYRSVETVFLRFPMRLHPGGIPEHSWHLWLWYLASLVHGAADSLLTLVMHNLGREAQVFARYIFEYLVWAFYYSENINAAELELWSASLREKDLLDDLNYPNNSERYRSVLERCAEVEREHPNIKAHRLPRFRELIGKRDDPVATEEYAFRYRIFSQVAHATVLGMTDAFDVTSGGELHFSFDSRLKDPNGLLIMTVPYIVAFLALLNSKLPTVDISAWLYDARWELARLQNRFSYDG